MFIDLEITKHMGAKLVRPKIDIKGCRFYLGQNWRKKIQALNLVNSYKILNKEIKYFFIGLPFEEVDKCFVEDLMIIQPYDKQIVIFQFFGLNL